MLGVTIIILAIGGVYVGYQQGVVIPRERIESDALQARLDREAEAFARIEREHKYDSCMADAYSQYSTNWDSSCTSLGLGKDCKLNNYISVRWDELHKEAQERCVTLFK